MATASVLPSVEPVKGHPVPRSVPPSGLRSVPPSGLLSNSAWSERLPLAIKASARGRITRGSWIEKNGSHRPSRRAAASGAGQATSRAMDARVINGISQASATTRAPPAARPGASASAPPGSRLTFKAWS